MTQQETRQAMVQRHRDLIGNAFLEAHKAGDAELATFWAATLRQFDRLQQNQH